MTPYETLLGALVGLARATDGSTQPTRATYGLLIRGLLLLDEERPDPQAALDLTGSLHEEKSRLVPRCAWCASPCGRNDDADPRQWAALTAEVQALQERLLKALKSSARCLAALGEEGADLYPFLGKGLFCLGAGWDEAALLPVVREAQAHLALCRARLGEGD